MITQQSQHEKCKHLPPKTQIHWNDDLNSILINLLEIYSNAFVGYIVKLFNSSCNINVIRSQVHNHIQYKYDFILFYFCK
jgi:hypothetical protein